jgi:hypothetical protein
MTISRKRIITLWVALWAIWLVLLVQPENRGILRLTVLVLFFGLLVGGLALFWKRKPVRVGIIALIVFTFLPLAFPTRAVDSARLRAAYIESLKPYEGTTYIWGGENRIGIDCSGLVRRGFICAALKQGLAEFNGNLVRKACELWWYDASAEAMRDEYRGDSVVLFQAPDLNSLDHGKLLPGDFAVTRNGVHTLVYIGDNRWMQADPGRGRAQYETIPVHDSGWFSTPVVLLRWRLLHDK